MSWVRSLLACLACFGLSACDGLRETESQHEGMLTIYAATNREALEPVIDDFRRLNPDIDVVYREFETTDLDRRFRAELDAGTSPADLLLSSAMDLQVAIVNDGLAIPHVTDNARKLPRWARWRYEALGFTFEPVVMAFNRNVLGPRPVPSSRKELMAAIRSEPEFWKGRIGTYDVRESSVGYLLASQDWRLNSDTGTLVEALYESDVLTAATSADILRKLDTGELVAGYNLLGSYARGVAHGSPHIEIVYPREYTLALSRTAVIPATASHPAAAHAFLDYLISIRGQNALARKGQMSAIRPEIESRYSHLGILESTVGPIRPITLGPGLLVYHDQIKRARLLKVWSDDPDRRRRR